MSILNPRAACSLPEHFSRFCRASLALAAAGFALAGCGSGSGGSGPGNSGSGTSATPIPTGTVIAQTGWTVVNAASVQPTKAWTFLVYMDGANDLDTDALFNFNQLESVGSSANVNIVVQFKRGQGADFNEPGFTYDSSEGGWGGTRRYYVTKDNDTTNISSFLLSTNANADMGSYLTMQQFVQWGIQTYPATHYALVIWDHGSGWRAETIPTSKAASLRKPGKTTRGVVVKTTRKTTTRGVAFDDVSSDYILTTQLGAAVDMGNGKKWDLIAWDCSLMQMAENDYEIKDKTLWIVGSEESPPGDGYPYDTILADLTSNPSWDGKAFGIDIAQKNLAFYNANPYVVVADSGANVSIGPNFVTQSVIDATQLAGVTAAINNLGAALSSAETNFGTQIATARLNTEEYGVDDVSPTDPTYEFYGSYRDPVDFVHQLIDTLPGASGPLVTDAGVIAAGKALRTAMASAVVETDNGTSHASSHGLALYIPTPADYATDDADQALGGEFGYGVNVRYGNLDFSLAAPSWQSFVATAKH